MIESIASGSRKLLKGTRVQHWRLTELLYRSYVKRITRNLPGDSNRVTVMFRDCHFDIERTDITILPTLITGEYEQAELDAFESTLTAGGTLIDVGANVGIHSVLGARTLGRMGKVFAVEPNVDTLIFLRSNLGRLNENDADVTIVSKALSNFVGESSWESTKYQGTSHLVGRNTEVSQGNLVTVEVTTLDELSASLPLDASPLFIKIDVEGFEPYVLEGARQLILTRKPRLLIEISGRNSVEVGATWDSALSLIEATYPDGQYFGPLAARLEGATPKQAISEMLRDGRLHNVFLIAPAS